MRYAKPIDEEEVKRLYLTGKCSSCETARRLGVRQHRVAYILKKLGILRSLRDANLLAAEKRNLSGEHHPNWKGGRIKTPGGYIMVRQPSHPRASAGGGSYVMEHIIIWEQVHNKPLPKGWVVHHLNGIKSDNRPSNLVGLPSRKHYLVLAAKAKRIRELEAELKLLEKALDDSQMVIRVSDN